MGNVDLDHDLGDGVVLLRPGEAFILLVEEAGWLIAGINAGGRLIIRRVRIG